LYRATGRRECLQMAQVLVSRLLRMEYTPQLLSGDESEIHGRSASTGTLILEMLELSEVSGDVQMLQLARKISDRVERYALQSHGAPTGHAEALAVCGPRVNCEYRCRPGGKKTLLGAAITSSA
jgi:hypothetical protein